VELTDKAPVPVHGSGMERVHHRGYSLGQFGLDRRLPRLQAVDPLSQLLLADDIGLVEIELAVQASLDLSQLTFKFGATPDRVGPLTG